MRRFLLLVCLFLGSTLFAEQGFLQLQGHLDKEAVARALDEYDELVKGDPDEILIQVNSSSGALPSVLELMKTIYTDREQNRRRISVYIDESAIGPAALVPFVADHIGSSLFVSWGDIPLGEEESVPANILRSRVKSVISAKHLQAPLLSRMAEAMADPDIDFDEGGVRAGEGETLVLNFQQMNSFGLLSADVSRRVDPVDDEPIAIVEGEQKPSFEKSLKTHIKYSQEGPNKVGLIRIDDRTYGINNSTWIYVKAALDHYKREKPAFIILELNTPGGEVFASQKISDALKEMDTTYDVPVVAYINNWAISAGAMLAYSCRYIVIVKDAAMGAAEPVLQGEGGEMKSASEKINSALRTDFANRAGFFDRDPLLAQAMVDKDMILVQRHDKIVKLDDESEIRRTGLNPDKVISAKGKLLTLSAEEMIDLGVVDARVLPTKLDPISDTEEAAGEWPAEKSLLFQLPFFAAIPNATIDPVELSWQLEFLAYLSIPAVASVLFLGMMMGGYMEINSPGFGLPGTVALVCLSLIVLSSFAMEAASWLELIMVVIGITLIALELFVIPGFGLPGLLGVILFVGGIFALMLPSIGDVSYDTTGDQFNAAGEEFMLRLTWLSGTLILGLILIGLLAKYVMPRMMLFNRLVLAGEQEGYVAVAPNEQLPSIGDRGEVTATLRPAGKVTVGERLYDVQSSGGFIEKGEKVVVVRIEGSRVFVQREEER